MALRGQDSTAAVTSGMGRDRKQAPQQMAARRFLARRGLTAGGASLAGARSIAGIGKAAGRDGPSRAVAGQPQPDGSGTSTWTAAGPVGLNSLSYGLVTGRVSALALDPSDASGNHLYAGTTGGGVWKSQNASSTTAGSVQFVPLTDDLGALSAAPQAGISVGAITVQPGGTGVVLAGLGDPNDALDSYYGAGLLRSTNGGATWTLIQQTMDFEDGLSPQDYSFLGEGFAGFAWSSTNVQLAVAAVSQAYEGTLVNAGNGALSYGGLFYSSDGGATWHLARIADGNGQDLQGPLDPAVLTPTEATSVVWNPVRQLFLAAVRYHGYYQSTDGITFTRLPDSPNGQPGTGITAAHCPTQANGVGDGAVGCPIFRGTLAVNPQTGDTFAWTVDAYNQDQGIWQDACGISANTCSEQTVTFGTQWNSTALETSDENGPATIENGDYTLSLAAVPSAQDTLLFAGDDDLWKCSLANSCVWRNTTNATSCMSARVGEYEHAFVWDVGNPLLAYMGNDGGLWRSTDAVGETGAVCSASDATHVQNLNSGLGSLAEVVSLGQAAASSATLLTGLGQNGVAGVVNAPAVAADWNEVLGGEGGPVAVDQTNHLNSWYANNGAGVSIFHCVSATACTAAGFGTAPVIGETQVEEDGLGMPFPANFLVDPTDVSLLLIGTCRVWRGPATGSGWSASNAISPVLDGTSGADCAGNALIGAMAALPLTGGGEVIYVGMTGSEDGGGLVPGHVFLGLLSSTGMATWSDLTYSPVTNSGLAFNAFQAEVSGIYVDPHDSTGSTVYVTIAGFSNTAEPIQQVYASTNMGATWTAITSNLPNAPANAVLVDSQDPNTVYVATDIGVYDTRAVGTCAAASCWAAYGTGLPMSPVTQLGMTPAGAAGTVDGVTGGLALTAGTYGRGVWQIPLATAGTTETTTSITPASLTFANTTIGNSSSAQTVTLKILGRAALTVTSVSITGPATGDFAEVNTCVGVSVANNSTCVVHVTFAPTQAGSRMATLNISGNVAGGQILVPLSGTGLATGAISLQPASLSFGNELITTTSTVQAFNVQNTGGSPVTIASIVTSAPFVKKASTCTSSLAAGAACVVSVAFAPTVGGAAAGSLVLTDSAGTQSAVLSGIGITGATDTLSPTSLSFPATVVGQNSILTVQISNTGGLPLTNIGTSISSPVSGDFSAVNNCGGTLAAGSSCTISVAFSPQVTGSATGSLVISDALRAQTVGLSGYGLAPPVITLSAASIAFGGEEVAVASTAKTLTITNKGGSPMAQPSVSISGSGSASFAPGTSTCGATLVVNSSCTVQVIFMPLSPGGVTATLTVTTSSPQVAAQSVALSGTGLTPPMLQLLPATTDLGSVVVGNSSAPFTFYITNTGQVALNGLGMTVIGAEAADFALSQPTDLTNACAFPPAVETLAPNGTCTVQVTFTASVLGAESATLTATGGNSIPASTTASLTGAGTPLIVLQSSVGLVSFPLTAVGQTSGIESFTISNLGRHAANGLTLSVTGPYQVIASQSTCKATLAQTSSCVVAMSFTPTAGGDQPGSLTAAVTNLGVAPLTVLLDGTGLAVGGIQLAPTAMTFGSVTVPTQSAAQTLKVTNSGQAALAGMLVSVTAGFQLTGNQCGATLQPGVSCTTGVVFTPTTAGNVTGTLTVSSSSAGTAPAMVSLTGYGVPAGSLNLSPVVASFGTVTVGQTSPAQTFTLYNAAGTTLAGLTFQVAGDYNLQKNACGVQLLAGATCTFAISFSPSTPGTRIGSVTIGSSNAGFTSVVAGLTGTGLPAAQLVVTPAALAFGQVAVGQNSSPLLLTVTNPGSAALEGLLVSAAPSFGVGSGSCASSLAGGGSCSVPVIFTPPATGVVNGSIVVSSTNLSVATVAITVSGTGIVPPSLKPSAATLTFPSIAVGVTSAGQTLKWTNPGVTGLSGLSFALSGAALGDFSITANSCTGALAAGTSCAVTLTFTPGVAGGRQAVLTASSTTAGVTSTAVNLSGVGLTPALVTMSPSQLVFAGTLVGKSSSAEMVTVANSGQSGITGVSYFASSGFVVDPVTTSCGSALAANTSCLVGVIFMPGAMSVGAITGSLTASVPGSVASGSNGPVVLATVALTGTTALPPGILVSPAVLSFGTIGLGQAGQAVTLTVTNQGTISALSNLTLNVSTGGSAGFGLSANSCGTVQTPVSLAAAASCSANVIFQPTATGPVTGTLTVSANGVSPIAIPLGGTGFDFQLSIIGATTATVIPGQTAYYTLAVKALGATSGSISFQCGNLPVDTLCVFNPAQLVGLGANATGNVTVGVATGAATTAAAGSRSNKLPGNNLTNDWRGRFLLGCAMLTLPLAWRRRLYYRAMKREQRGRYFAVGFWMTRALLALAMLSAGAAVLSCAGAGGSGGSGSQVNLGGGTPPGTYSVPVAATSNGVTHQVVFTLIAN